MYRFLQSFVDLGRKEKRLDPSIPDTLILGFIFQTIDIPNHSDIPQPEWLSYIKHILQNGLFVNKS